MSSSRPPSSSSVQHAAPTAGAGSMDRLIDRQIDKDAPLSIYSISIYRRPRPGGLAALLSRCSSQGAGWAHEAGVSTSSPQVLSSMTHLPLPLPLPLPLSSYP